MRVLAQAAALFIRASRAARYLGVDADTLRVREKRSRSPEVGTSTLLPVAVVEKQKNYCWAELMKRAFDFGVLVCPRCSGRMRVIATIMERDVIRAILEATGFPADSPPRAPAEPWPDESYWDAA